jgi:phage/plasmid-associated DNA primase
LKGDDAYSTSRPREAYIQVCDHVPAPRPFNTEPYAPFLNGFLSPHGTFYDIHEDGVEFSDFLFTRVMPFCYNKEATCPKFQRMMGILMPNLTYREKILIFFAYSLFPMSNNQQYHQLWQGGGNNGKTQLAENWGRVLGPLCSYVSLNSIIDDPHAAVGMRCVNLNISSEIAGVMLIKKGIDRCKSLMTDRFLTARDVYESQRNAQYPNTCRQLWIGNDLPYSEHMSEDTAFFRRIDFIPWAYIWKKVDWDWAGAEPKHIFESIFEEEAEGILAYVCTFIPRIGELDVNEKTTQKMWITAGSSPISFLNTPGINNDYDTEKKDLYGEYVEWCTRNEKIVKKFQTFFQILKWRGYNEIRHYDGDSHETRHYIEALSYDKAKDIAEIEKQKQQTLDASLLGGK